MHNKILVITATLFFTFSHTSYADDQALPKVPASEQVKIFTAAGFKQLKTGWVNGCGFGEITIYKDLNGDGLKDAVVADSSIECYGNTGVGYTVIAQQKQGSWKKIFDNSGIPTFLSSKGKDGWLDIENGGPGFCFAVYRWDGKQYAVDHYQYDGKTCSLF